MEIVNFTYEEFIQYKNVSRETFLRLQDYVKLLKKWQKKINLISNTTVPDIWFRHIIDSSQLFIHVVEDKGILDIGSGAGFPGLVLAILGIKGVTLVESDGRKAAFLKEAARITGADITVLNQRVEEIPLREFSTLTARGFAPLSDTFDLLGKGLNNEHNILFLKGKNHNSEIDEAQRHWLFDYTSFPSVTDADGVILSITHLSKKEH